MLALPRHAASPRRGEVLRAIRVLLQVLWLTLWFAPMPSQAQSPAHGQAQWPAHSLPEPSADLPAESSAESQARCPPAAMVPSARDVLAGASTARERGFLFRLSRGGHDSWLFGTVHVARHDWVTPGPAALHALRTSEVLALELDILDPSVQAKLRAGMAWRPERAVQGALARRLAAQVRAACLPDFMLSTMDPEMLSTTLLVLAARRDGLDPAFAIDTVLAGLGRALGLQVVSLETPELQLRALQSSSAEAERTAVDQSLDELEAGRAAPMLERIASVWAHSRYDELEHYAQWCGCLDTPQDLAQNRRLVDERNPGLAARIDALHAEGSRVFAAVGSLHLIGPNGLPALLAQRGFVVSRIGAP